MTAIRDAYNFRLKQNDLEPSIRRRLVSKETGNPISLAGATAKFFMVDSAGNQKINAAAIIETPNSNGIIRYDWQSGDTDTAGDFDAEFQITFPGNRNYTMPNDSYIKIQIIEDLGS